MRTENEFLKSMNTLLFTEHGECGEKTNDSQRCREGYTSSIITNGLAGLTCSLAMIPEAVSFAFVAGINPLVGVQTTVVMGLVASLFGARGGVMTGASGACAVVLASLCAEEGPAYVSAAVLVAGALQAMAGALRLGKYIRLVPHPVMLGFVNGLATVIARAQLSHFKDASGAWLTGAAGYTMVGLTALTAVLIKTIPLLTTAVPASLAAIAVTTAVAKLARLPATTLADMAGAETFAGGLAALPKLGLPAVPLSLATLRTVMPHAATCAAVGLIESLLTLQLVDGIVDDGTRGSTRAECLGQGLANIASGMTGGMGGCALIGQSLINVDAGGKARGAGVSMSVFLGLGIVLCAPLLAGVPIASLVGLMLVVSYSTFSWSSLKVAGRIPATDALVLALVSVVTVLRDLAVAVAAGTVLSALSFAWTQSTKIAVRGGDAAQAEKAGERSYEVEGVLFFGSSGSFQGQFEPSRDPPRVVIDFIKARVADHSALAAINSVVARYAAQGKQVVLSHLSPDCAAMLARLNDGEAASRDYLLVAADPAHDPSYGVAANRRKGWYK